ncbi:MAG: CD1247 N-terminal domain-containing protein [Bacillota bacterium]
MSDLRSKVAYLHGLAEGLDLEASSSEGRVLSAMIDVMGDLADAVEEVYDAQDELAEYVEEMDDDLNAMEECIFEEDEEDSEITFIPEQMLTDVEDGVELFNCPDCGETLSAGAGELENDEFEVTCPVCGCSLQAVDDDHGH